MDLWVKLIGKVLIEIARFCKSRFFYKTCERTWRCNDKTINDPAHSYCWPIEWLPKTLARREIVPKIILMSYPTSLTNYNKTCLHMEELMEEKSEKLLENIKTLHTSNNPIFIVGHSMGGLLVKKMILKGIIRDI